MKTASYDLAKAMNSKIPNPEKSTTLLEILGSDVDGSFREPIHTVVSASVAEISVAGQTIKTGGTSMSINIRDEGVLLSLNQTCVAFDLKLTSGFIFNALEIFQPVQATVGSLNWSVANGGVLNQSLLLSRPKKYYKKMATGMHICLPACAYTAPAVAVPEAIPGVTDTAVTASNTCTEYVKHIAQQFVLRQQAPDIYKVVIPLAELFPFLANSFPDQLLYLGNGQSLTCHAQINAREKWVHQRLGAAIPADFEISNMVLVKRYTLLDSQLNSLVLRSSLPLQKCDYLNVVQPMASNIVVNFNVSAMQRCRRIILAPMWNRDIVYVAAPVLAGNTHLRAFLSDAVATETVSAIKGPLSYAIGSIFNGLNSMQLSFGGTVRTINAQQLGIYGPHGAVIEGLESFNEDDPFANRVRSVFQIDLRRFPEYDAVGSSAGQHIAVQLQLTFNDNIDVLPRSADGNRFVFATHAANVSMQCFLETVSEASMDNSIYKTRSA